MMNMLMLVITALLCASCAHLSTGPKKSSPQSLRLSTTIKRQNDYIQSLRDENRILRQKLQESGPSKNYSVKKAVPPVADLRPADSENGEHYLYSKIIASYRSHKSVELIRSVEMLAKAYPQSAHLDNAYYLAGLLEVSAQRFARAEAWFDRILKDQPQGNKVVSALFAKAMTSKNLKRDKQARELLTKVQALYPGSSEARRAQLELKLLNLNKEVIR